MLGSHNAPKRSKLRLTIKRSTRRKALASGRFSASGHARLVVRAQRVGHLTVRLAGAGTCASARLNVSKR